jgi:glutathione S-transferase
MLTLHHLENSRSQRVLWLLEELGVPYELKTYRRNPATRLAPPELKAVHPLGKSPVITDDGEVIAESGAIIEYLVEKYGQRVPEELSRLQPAAGTPEHRQCRFWMHYAEGSLMNWLLMKLVFRTIPNQPMPFFARPIARALCAKVQTGLIDPNLKTAGDFIEEHLSRNAWFAGEFLSMADFQMSFPVEALLSRGAQPNDYPRLLASNARMH